MLNKFFLKSFLFYITFLLFSVGFLFSFPSDSRAADSAFKTGLEQTAQATGHKSVGVSNSSLPVLIGKIIYIIVGFVGVIFLALMIYGGYLWMLARGNEQQVEKARNIIVNSIIGLIIILCAYAITFLFMSKVGAGTIGGGGGSDNGQQLDCPCGYDMYDACIPC